MDRRNFIRSSLLIGTGLVVGDAALEAFERLTHQRKSFASAAIPTGPHAALWVRSAYGDPWVLFDKAPVGEHGYTAFQKSIPPEYTEAQVSVWVPEFTTSFNLNAFATLS